MITGERLQRLEFTGDASLDFDTIGFVVLSSVLACVALLTGSVPVLIGAMIIAPAFDPLVAIPFGLINRNWGLLRQGLLSSLVMFGISFAVCMGTTWILLQEHVIPLDLMQRSSDMITERLVVGMHSVVVALAAGAGGALASASNRKENLVGVVVALALVPALAAAAIGFQYSPLSGWGGLGLFGVNVAGIIVAGFIVLALRRGTGRMEHEVMDK